MLSLWTDAVCGVRMIRLAEISFGPKRMLANRVALCYL